MIVTHRSSGRRSVESGGEKGRVAVVGHGAVAVSRLRSRREEQLALAGGTGGGRRAARLAVAGEAGVATADERGV